MNREYPPPAGSDRYFNVGALIEHRCYRGRVVGVNFRDLTMDVRVTAVTNHGPTNRIGRTIEVPFNCGRRITTP